VNLVHPIETSFSVVLQSLKDAYCSPANPSSLHALGVPVHWIVPGVTQTVIPSAPAAHLVPPSHAPPPPPAPTLPPPPPTQAPAGNRRPGTQKEEDLIQLEEKIITLPWYAANTIEPTCGSPDCPYPADLYGVCGMSCYTAFVVAKPNDTFGCWREECAAYSTPKLDDAVKHQRANHFNHKPFLCAPANGTSLVSLGWPCLARVLTLSGSNKRFFSLTDLKNHRRRCH
jgi:hypothetical protein